MTRDDAFTIAERLAKALAESAARRDREGGSAAAEHALIRESGILLASIPEDFGGWGLSWPDLFTLHRRVIAVDGALGHLIGFHAFALTAASFTGTAAQSADLYRGTVDEGWFWGNAHNSPTTLPTDPGALAPPKVVIAPEGAGWRLSGTNFYSTGALGADMLIFSAVRKGASRLRDGLVTGVVPRHRKGVRPHGDWQAFGQRQTDSGAISFDDVRIEPEELFLAPGPFHDAFSTLRTTLVHLFLSNTYLGIAEGALEAALALTRSRDTPFAGSGAARISEDPLVLRRIGALALDLRAARALFREAAELMQQAWDHGHALTPALRGEVDAATSAAKIATAENGLRITAEIFELTGARSTTEALGLDRFWRNLRVHSLHDPVDQRLRDLGRQTLTGTPPPIAPKP